MATHHDDDSTMPEETQGYKLSQPKQSIAEYQQMGMSIHLHLHLTTFSHLPEQTDTVMGKTLHERASHCAVSVLLHSLIDDL